MDFNLRMFLAEPSPFRFTQATVVSVEADQTCTVTVRETTFAGVKYTFPPLPGGSCWLATDGQDAFVVAGLAGQHSHSAVAGTRSATQSVANNTWTPLSPDSEVDEWGALSSGSFTVPATGWWSLTGWASISGSYSDGIRALRWIVTGVYALAFTQVMPVTSGQNTILALPLVTVLTKGAAITLDVYQNSGSSLNVTGFMSAAWLGLA